MMLFLLIDIFLNDKTIKIIRFACQSDLFSIFFFFYIYYNNINDDSFLK